MIDLKYSLIIEATEDPNYFGFYSSDLEGFIGIGHSIEDCLYKAKWGMEEHLGLLKKEGLSIPETYDECYHNYSKRTKLGPHEKLFKKT